MHIELNFLFYKYTLYIFLIDYGFLNLYQEEHRGVKDPEKLKRQQKAKEKAEQDALKAGPGSPGLKVTLKRPPTRCSSNIFSFLATCLILASWQLQNR